MTYKWEAMVEDLTVERDRLRKALEPLAGVPIEDFGWQTKPDQKLHGWNGYFLSVSDVLEARAALNEKTE